MTADSSTSSFSIPDLFKSVICSRAFHLFFQYALTLGHGIRQSGRLGRGTSAMVRYSSPSRQLLFHATYIQRDISASSSCVTNTAMLSYGIAEG